MEENAVPALEMKDIVKHFGGVKANDHINFNLRRGEIHALLGENGAGKTTLMNILYGLYMPDEGQILLEGRPITIHSPVDALSNGIGMVHQNFMLIDVFSAAENVVLGSWKLGELRMNPKAVEESVLKVAQKYGLDFDPAALIETLPVGVQQRIEIVKALYRGARILILDEPTAVLTPQETEELFRCMRELVSDQVSIIYISHKLDEVKEISDRVTILRNGCSVGTHPTSSLSKRELAMKMIGRDLDSTPKPQRETQLLNFEVKNLAVWKGSVQVIRDVSFEIEKGEILGVAGVDGNGQLELANAIAGIHPAQQGIITIGRSGFNATDQTPAKYAHLGGAYIPQDRKHTGLVLEFNVAENLMLKRFSHSDLVKRGFLNHKAIRKNAIELVKEFDIRPPDPELELAKFSGGNQQKVILARELHQKPVVIIACYPTRGLDIGATEFVYQQLIAQRSLGASILFFSNELEELIAISDRIIVLHRGVITGTANPARVDAESLGLMMMGQKMEEA
jgi:general nucleoside transport system ATP-binding protein